MDKIKQLFLLDVIRHTGNKVEFPVTGNWGYLQEEVGILHQEGYLDLNDDSYSISEDGKKFLLSFRADMKKLLDEYGVYEEVVVNGMTVDARMPILAYKTRKLKPEQQEPILRNLAVMVQWDKTILAIKLIDSKDSYIIWQKILFDLVERNTKQLADRYCWRILGSSVNDAAMTAERLINPVPNKSLIQITR